MGKINAAAAALFLALLGAVTFASAQDKAELYIQTGQGRAALGAAFSPDDRFVLSGGADNTMRLWDAQSGREIRMFSGHSQPVMALAWFPDGKRAVSAGQDRSVRIWDVETGRELRVLSGHEDWVNRVAVSPDGKLVASVSGDFTLRLWDPESGKEVRKVSRAHDDFVTALAFSPDGRTIATGNTRSGARTNRTVALWETATGRELRRIYVDDGPQGQGPRGYARLAFSPDGRWLAGAWTGPESVARIYDAASGSLVAELRGHRDAVNSVAFSPDGKRIATASMDNTAKVWDTASWRELATLSAGTWVNEAGFSHDGRHIVTAHQMGEVKLWSAASYKEELSLSGSANPKNSIALAGRLLLVGGQRNLLQAWNVDQGKLVATFPGALAQQSAFVPPPRRGGPHGFGEQGIDMKANFLENLRDLIATPPAQGGRFMISALAASPDGSTVAVGAPPSLVKLLEVKGGRELRTLKGHGAFVGTAAFSPDGRILATAGRDRTVRIWDVASGAQLRVISHHKGEVKAIAFSPDGKRLVSGGLDDQAFIVDVASGNIVETLTSSDRAKVWSVAWSPDGRLVATGDLENRITLWDGASGRGLRVLQGHANWVTALAFSPDSQTLYSGSWDGTVREWDTASGSTRRTLIGHSTLVSGLVATKEGRLYSASWDGSVRVWDAKAGQTQATLVSFNDGEWVSVTPEGFFNSSENGAKWLTVRFGNKAFGLDQYHESFFRPDMVTVALSGQAVQPPVAVAPAPPAPGTTAPAPSVPAVAAAPVRIPGSQRIEQVKPAPKVDFAERPDFITSDQYTVKLVVSDAGGGVGDVRLYLNGAAVRLERTRNLVVAQAGNALSYPIRLVSGRNVIRAVAMNADNTMQSVEVQHEFEGKFTATRRPSLHAIVIGVQEFENPRLNLRFSVADAKLFGDTLKEKSKALFENINVVTLTSKADTTKAKILSTLREMSEKVGPEDLFAFFVASHGAVDEGDYFLITSNVGSTSTQSLRRDAISQNELKDLLANIPATKKLIVLDTCHAGKLGEALQVALLSRGMSEETALKILSRAMGTTILSASTSLQEAVEGYNDHGLFTYVIAEGLKGGADMDKDGFVKTTELADYVDNEVPELAEKIFKHKQYPVISPSGQGFPLSRVR